MAQEGFLLAILLCIFGMSLVEAQCPTGCKCTYKRYRLGFMKNLDLRNIQCVGANLQEMPDIPDQTGVLNLTGNDIRAFKTSTLRKLNMSAVFELYLDNNKITDIPSNTFKDLKNAFVISLKNNKISAIRTLAFAKITGYRNTETYAKPEGPGNLYLSGNPIASVEADAFADTKNLNIHFEKKTDGRLILKTNAFRKWEADEITFQGINTLDVKTKSFKQANVKKISVKMCTLSIESEGFSGVQYRRGDARSSTCGSTDQSGELQLESNELIDVPANMVKDSNPYIITLKNNTLVNIKPYAFNGTKRLCRLQLTGNVFSTLGSNSISGIIKEPTKPATFEVSHPIISIENNKFTAIDKNAFQGSKDVSDLSITHSGAKHDLRIRSEAFNGLDVVLMRIKGFNLMMEKDAFKGLRVTKNGLYIENNKLPSVCAYMFSGLRAMAVTIMDCKVNYVDEAAFKDANITILARIDKGNDLKCSSKLYCKWKRMSPKVLLYCKEKNGNELSMMQYKKPSKCPKKEPAPAGVCAAPKSSTTDSSAGSGVALKGAPLTTAILAIFGCLIVLTI